MTAANQEIQGVLYRVPTGEPVGIPRRHLAVFGVTRDSGKTTFVEAAVAASGMKAIVFRTKRGEIGFDNAKPLPLFFDERGLTHWKALEGLISATLEEKVHREPGVRYAIISVCKNPVPAKSLAEIHQRVKGKLKDAKLKEFIKEVFTKLDAYLEEVLPQLEKLRGSFSDRLELPEPGVYVEDLEGLGVKSDELQNLFVASLIRKAYEELSGVIIVVAEIWKFLPQDRGSPVKWVIEKYVREMGVVEGWLWLDAQDLRGVDKKHLRSFDIRLFGRQPDAHEIDEILKALPLPKQQKPKPEQIMTLKLGHFFAKLRDKVELTYVRPVWLPEEIAIRVAKGELESDSEEVQGYKPAPKSESQEDERMYRPLYEREKTRREELESEIPNLRTRIFNELKADFEKQIEEARQQAFREAMQKVEEIKKLWNVEEYQLNIAKLKDETADLKLRLEKLRTDSEAVQKIREGLTQLLPSVPSTGAEISKERTMEVTHVEVLTKTIHSEEIEKLTTKTVIGKILYAAQTDLKDKEWSEQEISDAMIEYGWNISHSTLAPTLGGMVRDGLLVRVEGRPARYRIPTKKKFEVEKEGSQ